MNFTKPKHDLIQEIRETAYREVINNIGNMHTSSFSSMGASIQYAITDAIVKSFEVLIDNTYTDQQFEEDTKLRT